MLDGNTLTSDTLAPRPGTGVSWPAEPGSPGFSNQPLILLQITPSTQGAKCDQGPRDTQHTDKSEAGIVSKLFVRENCYNTQL